MTSISGMNVSAPKNDPARTPRIAMTVGSPRAKRSVPAGSSRRMVGATSSDAGDREQQAHAVQPLAAVLQAGQPDRDHQRGPLAPGPGDRPATLESGQRRAA